MPLQIRRGTNAERLVLAVPPAQGEMLWITDEKKLYIGDGTTLANALTPVTGFNASDALDAAAAGLLAGTHENISFSYNGSTAISATVTLSDYTGTLRADGFQGSLFAEDSGLLVDADNGSINLDGTVKGHIIPDSNEAYDLGSAAARFRDLYLSGSSIKLGNATITSVGTAVDLPAGTTVNGAPIEPTAGIGGTLNIDIVGDDSSIIVNSSTNTVSGYFVGEMQGSLYGDDSTKIIDGERNVVTGNIASNNIRLGDVDNYELQLSLQGGNLCVFRAKPGNWIQNFADRFYVGSINETSQLRVFSLDDPGGNTILCQAYSDSDAGNSISMFRSRGNGASPAVLQVDDEIGRWQFETYDGTSLNVASSRIVGEIDDTISTSVTPGRLRFMTADVTGALGSSFYIDSSQIINVQAGIDFINASQQSTESLDGQTSRNVNYRRSRGSVGSEAVVQAADHIFTTRYSAYDGADYQTAAQIRGEVGTTVSTGITSGSLRFQTANTSGVLTDSFSINDEQVLVSTGGFEMRNALYTAYDNVNTKTGKITTYNRSRGGYGSESASTALDYIHTFDFNGHDGTNYTLAAKIRAEVNNTVGAGVTSGALRFMTANTAGTISNAMLINEAQTVNIYQALRLVPQTSAPSSPVDGAMYVADGTSWDPGSLGRPHPVFYDAGTTTYYSMI